MIEVKKLEFDLDDCDDVEMLKKVNAVIIGEDVAEVENTEPDYKEVLVTLRDKILECKGEAKSGTSMYKAYENMEEEFNDIMNTNDIDLD